MKDAGVRTLRDCVLFLVLITILPHQRSTGLTNRSSTDLIPVIERSRNRSHWLIEVQSSENMCHVQLNGRTIALYDKNDRSGSRGQAYTHQMKKNGMYAATLHPKTGLRTGRAFAHGHTAAAAFYNLEELLSNTQPGRIVVLCVLAEGGLSMDRHGERLMHAIGSRWGEDLQVRSMYALVAVKDVGVVAEGYSMNLAALYPDINSAPLHLVAHVARKDLKTQVECHSKWQRKRVEFCSKHDGYRQLCNCSDPSPLIHPEIPFENGTFFKFPIIILASNRPRYLYRCLNSLLANRGIDRSKVVVFSDSDLQEMRDMLDLIQVKAHFHLNDDSISSSVAKIAQAYRYTMQTAFEMFPNVDKIVLLEEDLEVSPDFVFFFQQTHHLLDLDPSLYCISAWNDNGYEHTVGDETLLYRIGFLPGLGWMLTRELFYTEMLPNWPPPWKSFDWDVMLRLPQHRKGRDCVIPDISRTYHFGFMGQHVESSMQFQYYYDHAFNTKADVKLRDINKMIFPKYEDILIELLKQGIPIESNGNETLCSDILPKTKYHRPLLLFIKMTGDSDTAVWEKLSTCLNLWDLDVRGHHRGIWRFWYNGNHIVTIGVPYSELSEFGMNQKQGVMVFGGQRSHEAKKHGRWPPGVERMSEEHRKKRQRYAQAELEDVPE